MTKVNVPFVGVLMLLFSIGAVAQTKTITNADLEQFRQKRIQAEKDLRENYEALGFPSPEVLEKRNAESRRELSALAQRIREEEAEREALAAAQYVDGEYADYSPAYSYPNPGFIDYGRYYAPSYFYGSYRTRSTRRTAGKHEQGLNRFRPFLREMRRISNGGNRVRPPVASGNTRRAGRRN